MDTGGIDQSPGAGNGSLRKRRSVHGSLRKRRSVHGSLRKRRSVHGSLRKRRSVHGSLRRRVIRDSLGVGLAVGAYGTAFGAASVAAGLSVLQTALLSLLAFTGGTQFAVVGVLAGGGTVLSAASGGLLLGARNTLYAMRMAPLLGVRGPRRYLAALGTIDESTAMAVAQPTPELGRTAFWWTFGGVYTCWNLFTLLGAAGAHALGDPARFGLDAVVPAAFLALLAPRLREGVVERRIAATAALIALGLIPFTPPGVPVLAACAALLVAILPRGTISPRRDASR